MKKPVMLLLLCLCFSISVVGQKLEEAMRELQRVATSTEQKNQANPRGRELAKKAADVAGGFLNERLNEGQTKEKILELQQEVKDLQPTTRGNLYKAINAAAVVASNTPSSTPPVNPEADDNAGNANSGRTGNTNDELGSALESDDGREAGSRTADREESGSLLSWVALGAPVALSLLALGLGGVALGKVSGLRREVEQNRNRVNQSVEAIKREQSNAAAKINTASSGDSGLLMRVAELQDEMQRMRDEMRSAQRAASVGTMATSAVAASSSGNGGAPQEDVFPIAAEAYLQKMQRTSIPLKPDVMNGVLVPAMDGGADFMLVNDTTIAADAFFIIPSVFVFQSKQDFFNFYERYYDCPNPSSGTVWILNPAVVQKVGSGWALREKGELEVR